MEVSRSAGLTMGCFCHAGLLPFAQRRSLFVNLFIHNALFPVTDGIFFCASVVRGLQARSAVLFSMGAISGLCVCSRSCCYWGWSLVFSPLLRVVFEHFVSSRLLSQMFDVWACRFFIVFGSMVVDALVVFLGFFFFCCIFVVIHCCFYP